MMRKMKLIIYFSFATITASLLTADTKFLSRYGQVVHVDRGSRVMLNNHLQFVRSPSKNTWIKLRETVAGVGDEGCKVPSPSGINTLPNSVQSLTVAAIFAGLFGGTALLSGLFESLSTSFPLLLSWKSTFPLLGPIFVLAGYSHFAIKEDFCNIMPATGAWGIWYVPGSKEFHVLWTGVAEILLGGLLTAGFCTRLLSGGGAGASAGDELISFAALGLLLLTVLVTPANIYMYTHGAKLPINAPQVPVAFHAIRGVLQIILCTQFYLLAKTNIFFPFLF